MVDEKPKMTHQCVLAAQKAKHILGCIKSSVASRLREVILSLCSALLRCHLEFCIQLWGPNIRVLEAYLWEIVVRRDMKMVMLEAPLI